MIMAVLDLLRLEISRETFASDLPMMMNIRLSTNVRN